MSMYLFWIVAALVTGYCDGQSLSISPVDSYTALVPVNIKCKADERKGLICAAEYPDQCKEQWNFPNPCTQQNLNMNITRFIHPFDTTKFLMCGEHGKLYVVQCPKHEVFHEKCGCVGKGTGFDASCEVPLAAMINNPCTQESILANKLFFPFPGNMSKFIHCDVWGKAWERTCTIDQVWSQYDVACVLPAKLNPCTRSTADLNFLYQHPCNPYKYVRCDGSGMAYETSCQQGTWFIEAVQGCQSVNSLSYRPEISCGPHTFGFHIYRETINAQTGISGSFGVGQVNQGSIHTNAGIGVAKVPVNQFNELLNAWKSSVSGTVAIVPDGSGTVGASSATDSFGTHFIGGSGQGGVSSTFGMGSTTGGDQSGAAVSFGIGTAGGSESLGTSGSLGANTVSMKDTSGMPGTFGIETGGVGIATGGVGTSPDVVGTVAGGVSTVTGGVGAINGGVGAVNGGIGAVNGGVGAGNGGGGSVFFGMNTATGSGSSGSFGTDTVTGSDPSGTSGSFGIGTAAGRESIDTSASFGTNTVSTKDAGGMSETFGTAAHGGTPVSFGIDSATVQGMSGSLGTGAAAGSGTSEFTGSFNMGSATGIITSGEPSHFSISTGTGGGVSVSDTGVTGARQDGTSMSQAGTRGRNPSDVHPALLKEYEFSTVRGAEPCTLTNVLHTGPHFKLKGNPHVYIQCDNFGRMFLKPCPADGNKKDYFDVFTQTCVDGPVHLPYEQLAVVHTQQRPFNVQKPFVF